MSQYCRNIFPGLPSLKSVKKALKKNLLLLNDQPAQTASYVNNGDVITLIAERKGPKKVFPIKIPVIFEDDYLAVVHKPAGIPVSGNYYKTLENAVVQQLIPSKLPDALALAKPVHRLDTPTSGLVLFAKTAQSIQYLGQQFEKKEVSKTYHAMVHGKTASAAYIQTYIDGKESITTWKTLETIPILNDHCLSLISLKPYSGRTHQIRIHMAFTGHPIVGEKKYAENKLFTGKGLFLCATKLVFKHPTNPSEVSFEIPLPQKFASLLIREKRRWSRYHS